MTPKRPPGEPAEALLLPEAQDPLTPAARLAELGSHRDEGVLRAVASNPSTPEATLRLLLRGFPVWVTGNVAWPLLALSDPRLAEEADLLLAPLTRSKVEMQRLCENPAMHRALVRNTALPVDVLTRLRASSDFVVLREIALHRNASLSLLESLAQSGNDTALKRLLEHERGARYLPGLEYHPSDLIREIVVRHPETAPEALLALASDRNYRIRGLVAEHPKAPAEALCEVYRNDHHERTRHLLASHLASPPELLLAIARRTLPGPPALFRRLAANPSAPEELLALLAGHSSKDVRDALKARLKGHELRSPRLPGRASKPRKVIPIR